MSEALVAKGVYRESAPRDPHLTNYWAYLAHCSRRERVLIVVRYASACSAGALILCAVAMLLRAVLTARAAPTPAESGTL